jgi:hypothetical protein
VAEVEDVAGSAGSLGEDGHRTRPRGLPTGEQPRRIKVPLDATVAADALPCVSERDPVIEPDDVTAGLGEELEIRRT